MYFIARAVYFIHAPTCLHHPRLFSIVAERLRASNVGQLPAETLVVHLRLGNTLDDPALRGALSLGEIWSFGSRVLASDGSGQVLNERYVFGPSCSFFVLGLQHVALIELRLALVSHQDYHMLLLAARAVSPPSRIPACSAGPPWAMPPEDAAAAGEPQAALRRLRAWVDVEPSVALGDGGSVPCVLQQVRARPPEPPS